MRWKSKNLEFSRVKRFILIPAIVFIGVAIVLFAGFIGEASLSNRLLEFINSGVSIDSLTYKTKTQDQASPIQNLYLLIPYEFLSAVSFLLRTVSLILILQMGYYAYKKIRSGDRTIERYFNPEVIVLSLFLPIMLIIEMEVGQALDTYLEKTHILYEASVRESIEVTRDNALSLAIKMWEIAINIAEAAYVAIWLVSIFYGIVTFLFVRHSIVK